MPAAESAHRRALALLALCGLLWSTAGALIKLVAWHPGAIWSARCAIAAALLYAIRRPAMRGQGPPGTHHGVAGPELLRLVDEAEVLPPGQRVPDVVGPVAHDHHDSLDPRAAEGIEHVLDHRPPANGNEDLGKIGFHPRPLTGRHDDGNRVSHR